MSVPDPATTDWIPLWNIGPGSGVLPADTLIPAATRIISNKLLQADTQSTWRVFGDGKQEWGPGGTTAFDVSLYRSTGGKLNLTLTTLDLTIGPMLLRTDNLGIQETWAGEANPRVRLSRDAYGPGVAGLSFGQGGASALDTTLYRSGGNTLATPGAFTAGGRFASGAAGTGGIWVDGAPPTATQFFGSYDATNAGIHVGSWKHLFRNDGYINLGAFNDTWIYRGAAQNVYVDNTLRCIGSLLLNQSGGGGYLYFSSAADAYMYREAASQIRTNSHINVDGDIYKSKGATIQLQMSGFRGVPELLFGPYGDASLYRENVSKINHYNSLGAWGTFAAAAFAVQSDRSTKSEIESAEVPVDRLLDAGVYTYERNKEGGRHLGLLADEMPEEVTDTATTPEGDTFQFIDLYKLTSAILATVQHLDERMKALEGKP